MISSVAQLRLDPNTTFTPMHRAMINRYVVGLKVNSGNNLRKDGQIIKRSWRIWSLSKDPVTRTTFVSEGRTYTVAEYFKETYGYNIRYPNLPCFNAVKSLTEPRFVPIEVAIVEDKQLYRKVCLEYSPFATIITI